MPFTNLTSPNANDALEASTTQTTSGNSTVTAGYAAARNLVVQLNVTAASGSTPTLNVVVQDTVDGTNWNTIVTFTQAIAAGLQVQRLATPFTDQLRVLWTIGGTTPSFTFAVQVYADN